MFKFVVLLAICSTALSLPPEILKPESLSKVVPIVAEDIDVEPDGSYHFRYIKNYFAIYIEYL